MTHSSITVQSLKTSTGSLLPSQCFLDIKNWMTENKLKLNSEETETLIVRTRRRVVSFTASDFQLADATVPFSPTVKSLGVYVNPTLSMQPHISFLTKICFSHLRRIAAIRRYLTKEACVKPVISLLFCRLDYWNSLLAGLLASSLQGLQRVQNCFGRLVLKKKSSYHSSAPNSALATHVPSDLLQACFSLL